MTRTRLRTTIMRIERERCALEADECDRITRIELVRAIVAEDYARATVLESAMLAAREVARRIRALK